MRIDCVLIRVNCLAQVPFELVVPYDSLLGLFELKFNKVFFCVLV
jgi:hypothetical protein